MNTLSMLTKARSDALAAYMSSRLIPGKSLSPDELYDYLLLDPQNGPEVMTSPVAEAIDSLQTFISRCLNGQEKDVDGSYLTAQNSPGGFFSQWEQYNRHYDRWAGREKLRYYAADYIDPALRRNKTEIFQMFEQQINHGKLTEQSVINALQTYLINYERLTRLVTINQLSVDAQQQIFFIARTTEDPCQFYWRQCSYRHADDLLWSDWLPVTAHIPGDSHLDIWMIWNRQRLHICWTENKSERQADGKSSMSYDELNVIALQDDRSWTSEFCGRLMAEGVGQDFPIPVKLVTTTPLADEWYGQGIAVLAGYARSMIVRSLQLPAGKVQGYLGLYLHDRQFTVQAGYPAGDDIGFPFSDDKGNTWGISVEVYDADSRKPIVGDGNGQLFNQKSTWTLAVPEGVRAIHLALKVFDLKKDPHALAPVCTFIDVEHTPSPGRITSFSPRNGVTTSLTLSDGISLIEALRASPEILFSYDKQTAIKDAQGQGGFASSYASWIWEIFFHIPFLVFTRFCDEQRFTESEKWAGYIFRPGGFRDGNGQVLKDNKGKPIFWNVIPLHNATPAISQRRDTDDPDAIALNNPVQYKLAVWMHYLDVLIAEGDQAYREEQRGSLARAKMYYIQAQQLLGSRPDNLQDILWQEDTLADVAEKVDTNASPFLPPFCESLLTYWDRIELRLYNLRHNLSLTGQPLTLPLFAPPLDPEILLTQERGSVTDNDQWTDTAVNRALPAERFPVLLQKARNAVSGLIQLGNTFELVLRNQDEQAATLLLLDQQKAIQQETAQIQRNQFTTLNAGLESLKKQIVGAEQRRDFLLQQLNSGVSNAELTALTLRNEAVNTNVASVTAMSLAGALDLAPNIFGVADGGSQWGAASSAAGMAMQTMAAVKEQQAGILETTSGFARRQDDWQQQLAAVRSELDQLRSQLKGAEAGQVTAQKQLALTLRQQDYAQAILDMQTTRFTGKTLNNWMTGRLTSLYRPYYDMVHALCLSVMRAFQYDTGARETVPLTGSWSDLRQGLLAGEGLMLILQKLEHDWLSQRQKALDVQRTVSLETHFNKKLLTAIKSALAGSDENPATFAEQILHIAVSIKDLKLQDDYPPALNLGNRRQIKQISVTLPALLAPYQDIQALLRYDGTSPHAPGCEIIAISHGMDDGGQFQLDFSSPEFLPFEGIPIDDPGNLILQFPVVSDQQKALLNSLSDIILHIRYTIRRS